MSLKRLCLAISAILILSNTYAIAAGLGPGMEALIDSYRQGAGVKAFSAEEGKKFFNSKSTHSQKKEERSCTTCHTEDPKQTGKTAVGKPIEPMAPSVNKERFTDPKKVEKWFKRNCEWTLERECTPKEKGDFITYMLSVQ